MRPGDKQAAGTEHDNVTGEFDVCQSVNREISRTTGVGLRLRSSARPFSIIYTYF